MLWTIVVLGILWLLGFSFHVGGSLIHLLLVVGLIVLVFNVLTGRRTGVGRGHTSRPWSLAQSPAVRTRLRRRLRPKERVVVAFFSSRSVLSPGGSGGSARPPPAVWSAGFAAARGLRAAAAAVAGRLRTAWSHRAVRIACPIVADLILLPPAALVEHVYFDRSDLPDLAPFILFQPPTTGEILDARGEVVIQLAREYRRVVTYDEVPLVVRQAILAAEDKNFDSALGGRLRRAAPGDPEDGGALSGRSGRTAPDSG